MTRSVRTSDDAWLKPSRVKRKSALVYELMAFIRGYVVMTRAQLLIVALWIIHTYCTEAFEQTPYLSVTSPEKQCGKTRFLETLEVLVARAWMAILPSEAVLYRTIDKKVPTLLLDEVDTIFNPRSADRYEGLRAVLNAGHRRGNRVPRCFGPTLEVVEFDTFCPKVLAGIGTLPDTVADRSVPIRLERRKRGEEVERFIRRDVAGPAARLRDAIEAWGDQHREELRPSRPTMPDALSDRMQEGCECLVAIAAALGLGDEARRALIEVFSVERLDDQESMRLRLLSDIKAVFERRDARAQKRSRGIATNDLLAALHAIEEAPWATYYGRGLEARDLANLLRHYGLHSGPLRIKGDVKKGYKRDPLHEAWERYLT